MTEAESRALVARVMDDVVPGADVTAIADDADMREELDIDSMDFLNFVAGLVEATGQDIPEADYDQIVTLRGCAAYLTARSTPGS